MEGRMNRKEREKVKRRNRMSDTEKYRDHLKFLSSLNHYPSGAYLKTGSFTNQVSKEHWYYKRYYRGKASMYLKRQASKKVRRKTEEIKKGGSYRKVFDFWWELL